MIEMMKRGEKLRISHGEGLLEIRGSAFDSALLFQGAPIILRWFDCEGSVGQYLMYSKRVTDHTAAAEQVRHFVSQGPQSGQRAADQIAPLLRLFANGRYRLDTIQPAPQDWTLIEYTAGEMGGAYPFPDWTLLATRPSDSLDKATVEEWKRRIGSGDRPFAITASADQDDFLYVVDGHHKLKAYESLAITPMLLNIVALTPRPLDLAEAEKWIPDRERRAHYREHKQNAR